MANPEQNNEPVISRTEQKVLNQSMDKDFNILAVELVAHEPVGNTLDRVTIDTSGNLVTKDQGASTIANGQVTVASTSTEIVPARSGRRAVVIINLGATDVYLGTTGVTTSTGLYLMGTAGASVQIPTSAAVYGVVGSGTQAVSYMEVYD